MRIATWTKILNSLKGSKSVEGRKGFRFNGDKRVHTLSLMDWDNLGAVWNTKNGG